LRGQDGESLAEDATVDRGASGLAPENTLAASKLAIAQGAPAVECDVHLTRDGAPIVIHDERVGRTTDGEGEVAALT
jgi:glycerophosphoryl diester phosphodiesterase